jgi:hypothetical protein
LVLFLLGGWPSFQGALARLRARVPENPKPRSGVSIPHLHIHDVQLHFRE